MIVVWEPAAFGFLPVARNVTMKSPWSAAVGCHVSVPVVLPEPGVKTASLPGGRADRSAVNDEMLPQLEATACPSTETGSRYLGTTMPGAKTRGGALGVATTPSLSFQSSPSRLVWSHLGP